MRTLCLVLMLFSSASMASMRQYSASVETSNWMIEPPNRLQCVLMHDLPGYGTAMFTSEASKTLNMEFELDMLRLPKTYGVASVYSVPPKWMPGEMHRNIADMQLRKQFNGDLPERAAWTMLSELEKGYWPTVYYQDWYNRHDMVAVALNSANFARPYQEFVECVSNLLPFSFDDIAYTVLSYKKNSVELTKGAKKKLDMIGDYLREDSDLELVLLDGYSDSHGGRWKNQELSIQRAEEVRDYFAQLGVDPGRIEITGHGERRHAAPNTNADLRAKNRRVVIRMQRS